MSEGLGIGKIPPLPPPFIGVVGSDSLALARELPTDLLVRRSTPYAPSSGDPRYWPVLDLWVLLGRGSSGIGETSRSGERPAVESRRHGLRLPSEQSKG